MVATTGSEPAAVLLVEGRDGRRERIESALEAADGLAVRSVGGADAALDALTDDVECVLSAQELADGEGTALVERVSEERPHLPFVLVPADGSGALASRALAAGASDYVAPEVLGPDLDGLAERVREHVAASREARGRSESDRRFRTLVENLPGVVYRAGTGDSWPFEYVDGEVEATTGYTAEQLRETVDWEHEVVHPADRERVRREVAAANAAGEAFEVTYRIETPAGEERWLWERGREVEPGVLEGFLTDVTERRGRERELRETNELLGSVVEATPAALVAIDPDGRVCLWNPAAERIFGWSEAEVLGEPLPFVPEDRREEHERFRERLLDGERVEGVETQRLTADGERVDVSISIAPAEDADGDVVACTAAILDVTERRARERELERTRNMLRNAERLADVGAWEWDVETDEVRWSDGIRRIFEVSEDFEPTLGTVLEFVHPEDRDAFRERLEAFDRGGRFETATFRIVTAAGRERWIRSEGEVVEREDGKRVVRGFTRDVTERKRRDHQVAVLDRVLRHNLRSDLGEIVDRAETIAERTEPPASDAATAIADRGTELQTLANKHREVAKLLSEPQSLHEYDVLSMLERVVDQMRETYPDADIECSCPPPVRVVTTAEVEAAVAELVENGVVHGDAEQPAVEVRAEVEDDAVVLEIADDGPGLPEPRRETIRRAGDVDPLDHSGGMGLWLAKWIVSRAGGTIAFEDAEAGGTLVRVRLPRTPAELERGREGGDSAPSRRSS